MSTDLSIEQCAIVLRYVTDAIHEHFTAVVGCGKSTRKYFTEAVKQT